MKILLDECLNWRLKKDFEPHEVYTVQDMGWSGIVNGELLTRASKEGFKVFITIDKNLKHQLNLKNYKVAVIVFQTRLNRVEYIRPLIPTVLSRLEQMTAGEVYEIS